MSETVRCKNEDGVLTVTLNRPEALNAISMTLTRTLVRVLREANADAAVRGIVLTGAGEKAFCAGVDLGEARAMTVDGLESWFGDVCEIYRRSSWSTNRW